MKKIKRMLITGVSGLLGNNLAYYFKDKYEVLGVYNTHPVEIEGVKILQADLLSDSEFREIVIKFKPSILVHCAAITSIDYCETHRDITDRANVDGTRVVAESIERTNTKLIYISTESVYDCVKGDFSENDSINPPNYYGLSKYRGELKASAKDDALILRTNIFGWNIQEKYSIGEWIISELEGNRNIEGFKDVYFSSIYTFDFAKLLEKAIEKNLKGIYNLTSSTSMSKFDFALHLAEYFPFFRNLIKPIFVDDYHFEARRGKNLTLNVSKLQNALQCRIPTISESIYAFYKDYRAGLPKLIKKGATSPLEQPQTIINYGRHSIDENDIQAVVDVLRSQNITQGPKVTEFELALCEEVDAKFAVAVNSGTAALHIACLAVNVGPGDEVITSPNTFVASANCAVYCGAKPVFADVDPATYNILPEEVEKKITAHTKAVIPVHFAGQSCHMEAIQNIVHKAQKKFGNKIYIIEDACHALGSFYKGTKVGSCRFSDITVTSFHPVKHITSGEGGALFINDESLFRSSRLLRSHGITGNPNDFVNEELAFQPGDNGDDRRANPWYYEQIKLGYNYRINDIQCALGLSQLKKLPMFSTRRRAIVDMYNKAFKDIEFIHIPFEHCDCLSNFHLYVLLIDFDKIRIDRAQFVLKLKMKGIQTQVHYIPLHLHSYYRENFGTGWGDCPNMEMYYAKCLTIPLYPAMIDEDVERVIYEIKEMVLR